jgi:uncharacterized iron-regulated membrane protein
MFLHYLALVLEWVFFIGLAGSLLVATMAFMGDLHVFFDKDEEVAHIPGGHVYSAKPAGGDD